MVQLSVKDPVDEQLTPTNFFLYKSHRHDSVFIEVVRLCNGMLFNDVIPSQGRDVAYWGTKLAMRLVTCHTLILGIQI